MLMKTSVKTFLEWSKLRSEMVGATEPNMAISTDGSANQMATGAKRFLGTQTTRAIGGTTNFVNALAMISQNNPALLTKVVGTITSAIRSLKDDEVDPETKEQLVNSLRASVPGLKQLEGPPGAKPSAAPTDQPTVGGTEAKPLGNIRGTPA